MPKPPPIKNKILEAYGQLELAVLHLYAQREYVSFEDLESYSGLSRSIFRPIINSLIASGYISRMKGGINDDGEVVGGTWTYITSKGRKFYEGSTKPGGNHERVS